MLIAPFLRLHSLAGSMHPRLEVLALTCTVHPRARGEHMLATSQGGRYNQRKHGNGEQKCFNPRPPRKVGATTLGWCCRKAVLVSILAHLARWALRRRDSRRRHGVGCFNPRPPRKVGATLLYRAIAIACLVSILAHLARWALRRRDSRRRHGVGCFNPRPPRKVGATLLYRAIAIACLVSILAHLARWALPGENTDYSGTFQFQSSPTSQGGRYHAILFWHGSCISFNPRPPRKVGATFRGGRVS